MRLVYVSFVAATIAAAGCLLDRGGTLGAGAGGGGEAPTTTSSAGGGCAVEACPGYDVPCTFVECAFGGCSTPAPTPNVACTKEGEAGICSAQEAGLCLTDLGSDCSAPTDCGSGHCVDGQCCDAACDALCVGCVQGTCGPLPPGETGDGCEGVCDGVGTCVTGEPLWAKAFGKNDEQSFNAVAVQANGALAVGGNYKGTAHFDGTDVTATNNWDAAVLRFTAAGDPEAPGRYLPGQDIQIVEAVTYDHLGRIVVCGWFKNQIDLGEGPISANNGEDAFVAAYAPGTSAPAWWHTFGAGGNDQCMGVAADITNQAVIVTGWFSGTDVAFGESATLSTAGNRDVFVARIDAGGEVVWARAGAGNGEQEAYDVAVDGFGNAIVTGRFKDSIDVAGGGPTAAAGGTFSAFVAKLDVGGSAAWTIAIGDAAGDTGMGGVAVAGDVIVAAGMTRAPLAFGSHPPLTPNGEDALVVALDGAGTITGHAALGEHGDQRFRAVAIDPEGSIVLVGDATGATTVGGETLTANARDALVMKLAADLTPLWGRLVGGTSDDFGLDVGVDGAGNIVAVGRFTGTMVIAPHLDATANGADAWLAAFAP